VALNHAAAAALGNRVYVAGGSEQFGRPPRREVYVLDLTAAHRVGGAAALPEELRWQPVAPMPSGRWAPAMAALGGQLVLAGGTTDGEANGGLDGAATIPALAYDPVADRWTRLAPPAVAREHLGAVAAGGLFYTVGGRWNGRNLGAVEAYDPGQNRWLTLPPLPVPRSGLGVAAVHAGDRSFIVAAGGEDPGIPGRVFAEADVFDTVARTWRSIPPLPTPRHGVGGAGHGANAYFLAGATLPGARSVFGWSGAVEIYRLDPRRQ
jgi:hypothetical protein